MFFLGQAANYQPKQVWEHLLAFGTSSDFQKLKVFLSQKYQTNLSAFGKNQDSLASVQLYHNGRSALSAGLKAIVANSTIKTGVKPGIIVNSFTCYAVISAIQSADCQPIFADINLKTLHFDAESLKRTIKLHPEAIAVIVQNSLGIAADITSIAATAVQHQLVLVEDLAHCTGVTYADGREVGTVGAVTALSFGKGKSIDTISGGALILRDSQLKLKKIPTKRPLLADSLRDRWYPFFGTCIRAFYNFGFGRKLTSLLIKLHWIERSADAKLNFSTRLTYWQAKLALKQLKSLPKNRPPLRTFYLVKQRDTVLNQLERQGFVFNDTWYDTPVAPERYFKTIDFPAKACPHAIFAAEHIINFPSHYSKTQLKPAQKFIKPYLINEQDRK